MSHALVVLSGGQDSTTCLFWAKRHFDQVHALTFDYDQRHRAEIQAACKVAVLAGVASHEVLSLGPILKGRSPLTDKSRDLDTYTSFEAMEAEVGDRIEATFVPMRNALFLTLAANRAVCLDCYDLVTGVCQQDNANYPDCRQGFIDAQGETIAQALGVPAFRIHTPLMNLSKAESIQLARELPGAFEALAYSHTCYAGAVPPCGSCHACLLRAEGFAQAGVVDPLLTR